MSAARILIIAGSDSGGGAGIQADIKTVTALGGYAMTAITALTAQNTRGVQGVVGIEPAFIREQIRSVVDDLGVDCVKTGMLHDRPVIDAVADELQRCAAHVPWVIDPVMVAQSGDRLVADDGMAYLRDRLIPDARLITPNIPEAQALLGRPIESPAAMDDAARALLALGCEAVLLKGGHLDGETLIDVLATAKGSQRFEHPRIATTSDHGTGCTLASAIAEGLGRELALDAAVHRGRDYLHDALASALPLGHGHGPVNHSHTVAPYGLRGTDNERT